MICVDRDMAQEITIDTGQIMEEEDMIEIDTDLIMIGMEEVVMIEEVTIEEVMIETDTEEEEAMIENTLTETETAI